METGISTVGVSRWRSFSLAPELRRRRGRNGMILKTDRLTIRKFEMKDVDDVFALRSDPEIMKSSAT